MNKKILKSKENEIAKAGRMVFDALFGDSDEFEKKLEQEIEEDAPPGEIVPAVGHSLLRCLGCAREQGVPPGVDVFVLEQQGWRFDGTAWRCPFCVARLATSQGAKP
jgi:hypothetical protein